MFRRKQPQWLLADSQVHQHHSTFNIHCHRALLTHQFQLHLAFFAQSPLLSIAFFKVDRLPVPTVTQSTSDLSTFFSSTQSGCAAAVPANSSSGMRCGERNPMKFVPLKWKLGFWLWRYLRTRHLRGVLCWKPILCASCNVSNSRSMVWLNCEFTFKTGS